VRRSFNYSASAFQFDVRRLRRIVWIRAGHKSLKKVESSSLRKVCRSFDIGMTNVLQKTAIVLSLWISLPNSGPSLFLLTNQLRYSLAALASRMTFGKH